MMTKNHVNDPIGDVLTRIRNALLVNKSNVKVPYSKNIYSILQILHANKFISRVNIETDVVKSIDITLSSPDSNNRISTLQRISTPGRHIYVPYTKIPYPKSKIGIVIISTSRGIMTGFEARKKKIGGELICEVF